jgi:hypothetical protein
VRNIFVMRSLLTHSQPYGTVTLSLTYSVCLHPTQYRPSAIQSSSLLKHHKKRYVRTDKLPMERSTVLVSITSTNTADEPSIVFAKLNEIVYELRVVVLRAAVLPGSSRKCLLVFLVFYYE